MSKEERPSDQLARLIMEIGGGVLAGKVIGVVIAGAILLFLALIGLCC